MSHKLSEKEKLESLIFLYRQEQDSKKKHILYLSLVEESLRLVKSIVMSIYPVPVTISSEDLIQVGAIGVLKAIKIYKVEEKGSFLTYASRFIKGNIFHYIRDKANLVRTPREISSNIVKVKDAINILSGDGGDIPSAEEISKYTKIPQNKVEETLNYEKIRNIVSLDQSISSYDGIETILDRIQSNEETDSYAQMYENKKIIQKALQKLPASDRTAIYDLYMEGMTRKEIAQKLGVSQTHVSRIIKRALNSLSVIIQEESGQIQI